MSHNKDTLTLRYVVLGRAAVSVPRLWGKSSQLPSVVAYHKVLTRAMELSSSPSSGGIDKNVPTPQEDPLKVALDHDYVCFPEQEIVRETWCKQESSFIRSFFSGCSSNIP